MDISQIEPWVDPAPSHERDMRLDQIRQQIKKKKPWAYRYLAARYKRGGPGLKRSTKKANVNYKKGALLGDSVCMNKLGMYWENNNDKLAFKHYHMAAHKGYHHAQRNLGDCYSNGVGVTQSNSKAREWYNRAAAQDNEDAIESLEAMDEEEEKEAEEKKEVDEKKAKKESTAQIMKEEPIKTEESKSESPTSTNIDDNQDIEIKDTKDIEIVPWINDVPKNVMTMTLNKLRTKVKKKKAWAMFEMGRRYEYGNGGVEVSLEKVLKQFRSSANNNSTRSAEATTRLISSKNVFHNAGPKTVP